MSERPRLIPDQTHPITIEPTGAEVVVRRGAGSRVVARSSRALTLREADYPPVQYLPLADVDADVLEPTEHTTYCPYKGDAGYYTLVLDGNRAENAVWTYPSPYDAVAPIAGHVAFYPEQVEITVS